MSLFQLFWSTTSLKTKTNVVYTNGIRKQTYKHKRFNHFSHIFMPPMFTRFNT